MSEVIEGRPWGLCCVYGCPLLGSIGHQAGDGKWYCFCHINMPFSMNDAITMALNSPELDFIVKTTLQIRAHYCSFYDSPKTFRMIQDRLERAGRPDLMYADVDKERGGAKAWLMRLERELIDKSTGDISNDPRSATVPTAPVIGPTHADTYHPYAQGGE